MIRVEIIPTEFSHIRLLCENMREREREAFMTLGESPERVLTQEVAKNLLSYTGLADGKVVVIWGARCDTILSDEAFVWAVFTEHLYEVPITMLRHSREGLDILRSNFKRFHGFVLGDFECSQRWLRWLGFTIDPPEGPFCRFRMG